MRGGDISREKLYEADGHGMLESRGVQGHVLQEKF